MSWVVVSTGEEVPLTLKVGWLYFDKLGMKWKVAADFRRGGAQFLHSSSRTSFAFNSSSRKANP